MMPFGKHKGKLISEIPTGYLLWLERECDLDGWLRVAVERELDRRPRRRHERAGGTSCNAAGEPGMALGNVSAAVGTWWRELVMRHHPDRGGDVEVMKALNNAHKRLKELLQVA
jgi:hypothetical protein